MNALLDVLRAHRKAVVAIITVLLVQFVDSETADWVAAAVGSLLVVGVPNDPAATDRVWRRR